MARLVVRQAPDLRPDRVRDLGREFAITEATVMVGRAKEAAFSLNSANVSKRHAEICFQNGSFFICDLGSTQGTKLNGLPVSLNPAASTRLRSGDRISLADTVLEFIDDLPGSNDPKINAGRSTLPPLPFPPPVVASSIAPPPVIPPQFVPVKVPEIPIPLITNVVAPPVKKATQILPPPNDVRMPSGSGRMTPVANAALKNALPIFLILDGSGSMTGEPMAAIKAGLVEFFKAIKHNPALRDGIDLTIVFFGSDLRVMNGPFSAGSGMERELAAFKASGLCPMGAAIREAARLFASVKEQRRPPLFFIAIDGIATDVLDDSLRDLQAMNTAMIVACELGEHADASPLATCAQKTLIMKRVDKTSCESAMRWLSEVVKTMASENAPMDRAQFKWPAFFAGSGVDLKS